MTDTKRASNAKHAAKLAQISIKPPRQEAEAIKAAAKAAGESVQGYILRAVHERMADDGSRVKVSIPRATLEPYGEPKQVLTAIIKDGLQRAKHNNV